MSRKLVSGFLLAYLTVALASPIMVWAQDPGGGSTGTAADVPAATPGVPNMEELANAVGHNRVAINMMRFLGGSLFFKVAKITDGQ